MEGKEKTRFLKEEAALTALLQTASMSEAIEKAGISKRSMYAFLADPIFRARLAEEHAKIREAIVRRLSVVAAEAVAVIYEVMITKGPAATRLRAASTLLDHWGRTHDLATVLDRVAQLEAGDETPTTEPE